MKNNLLRIVITGGPCAGKTAAIQKLKLYFEKKGYFVVIISEVPTEIITSGITLERFGKILFQKAIINLQIEKERIFLNILSDNPQNKTIVIYDRGIIDHFTYTSEHERNLIEEQLKINKINFYKNYDAVFHMCSTAKGLPHVFSNTEYRNETVEMAAAADDLIRAAWIKHPNYYFIKCEHKFNNKIKALISKIEEFIELKEQVK